jgi:hypothetical protein
MMGFVDAHLTKMWYVDECHRLYMVLLHPQSSTNERKHPKHPVKMRRKISKTLWFIESGANGLND